MKSLLLTLLLATTTGAYAAGNEDLVKQLKGTPATIYDLIITRLNLATVIFSTRTQPKIKLSLEYTENSNGIDIIVYAAVDVSKMTKKTCKTLNGVLSESGNYTSAAFAGELLPEQYKLNPNIKDIFTVNFGLVADDNKDLTLVC
jgi:hypothetical protein